MKFYQVTFLKAWNLVKTIYLFAKDEEEVLEALSKFSDESLHVEVTDISHLTKISELVDPKAS